MRYLFVICVLPNVFLFSCKREKQENPTECAIPAVVPFQPYSDPVWHPNGNLLGFNHTPLAGIASNGTAPCIWYSYLAKADSAGFYLMNKDGTGLKRVTNFKLITPSWSPDGNWIAFSMGSNIYKMPFTGNTFDTTRIIQLTNAGGNFYPSWTTNSDSLYFDSNVGSNGGGYYVWKTASDSSGKMGFPNTGRQPFVGSDGKVYYVGLAGEIYQMNSDGSSQQKYSNNGFAVTRPKYWQGKVFYETNQIGVVQTKGSPGLQLMAPAVTYDVSRNGEIVYGMFDFGKLDREWGTLWIMNADGTNKRQLTFNHY